MKTLVVGIKLIAIFNNIPELSNKLGMCGLQILQIKQDCYI